MLREAAELRAAIAAGADLRDARRRRPVPLSASSVRKVIGLLAMLLDDAVEDELIERSPARGKRMRIQVPKPARTFLELDELADLVDAAGSQDAPPRDLRRGAERQGDGRQGRGSCGRRQLASTESAARASTASSAKSGGNSASTVPCSTRTPRPGSREDRSRSMERDLR